MTSAPDRGLLFGFTLCIIEENKKDEAVQKMGTICGADCDNCGFKDKCAGCEKTCGSPFGGRCAAAEYIKSRGKEAYAAFKGELLKEVNGLLKACGLPEAAALAELPGFFVNLAYPLPGGERVKFLEDKNVYLGTQVELAGEERCVGAVADEGFILLCSYGANGADPKLLAYRKR